MKKGKINKEINIEEMIVKFPDIEELFNELIKLQNPPKEKRKSNKKSRLKCREITNKSSKT